MEGACGLLPWVREPREAGWGLTGAPVLGSWALSQLWPPFSCWFFGAGFSLGSGRARDSDDKHKGFSYKDKFNSLRLTIQCCWTRGWYGARDPGALQWGPGSELHPPDVNAALPLTEWAWTRPSLLICMMGMMLMIPTSWPCCVESKWYQACTVPTQYPALVILWTKVSCCYWPKGHILPWTSLISWMDLVGWLWQIKLFT